MPLIHYVWDPVDDNILRELDENGNIIAEYSHEPGLHGKLISERRGGEYRQYHFDLDGNTVALTDEAANVTDTFAYTAFGEVTERTGTHPTPFQYRGQFGYLRDELTADYLARQREYDPRLGRWLSADPLRLADIAAIPHRLAAEHSLLERLFSLWPDEANVYAYVGNDPINFGDPSGLLRCKPIDQTPFACNATGKKAFIEAKGDVIDVGGKINIIGSFFDEKDGECKSKCCAMELWVRGHYVIIGPPPMKVRVPLRPHVLEGSGKPLDPKVFQQDSPRLFPTPCKLNKTDSPSIPIPKAVWDRIKMFPGVEVELRYDFELHAIDTCNNDRRVATYDYTWEIRGPLGGPDIKTDLADC